MNYLNSKNYLKNIRIITIFLFTVAITFFALDLVNPGYDSYWHITAGKQIFNSGIPVFDTFSWFSQVNNLPWIAHEWLSEVVFYFGNVIFGTYSGLIFCTLFLFLILFFLFIFSKKEYCKDYRFTFIWTTLGIFTIGSALSPRPHLFSYLLFVFTLYILYDFYFNERSRKIYFLPLIGILWSNFHGGSSNLIYILLSIFFISELLDRKLNPRKIKKYIMILLTTITSLLINPYGIKMIFYPYLNMADTFMKKMIVEWQPPSLTNVKDLDVWIFLGITLFFIIKYFKKYRKIDILLFISFFILSLTSIRFVPLFYIATSFFIFIPLKEVSLNKKSEQFLQLFSIFILIFSLFKIPGAYNVMNKSMIADEAINYLKEKEPKRLFNYYDYGGYLIYSSLDVFVDGRADVYSKTILKDSYKLSFLIGDYEWIIKNYNFDYYIIPKDIPLNKYLKSKMKYQLIFEDNDVVLYETKKKEA